MADDMESQDEYAGENLMNIYVGNLTWWTTDQDISELIWSVGVKDIMQVNFFEDERNGMSRGLCVITLGSERSLQLCKKKLANMKLHGQTLVLYDPSKEKAHVQDQSKTCPVPLPNPGLRNTHPHQHQPRMMQQGHQPHMMMESLPQNISPWSGPQMLGPPQNYSGFLQQRHSPSGFQHNGWNGPRQNGPQRDTPPQGPHPQGPQARPPPIPFQGSPPGQGPPTGRMPPDPRGLPLCPDWNRPAGLGYLLHIQPPPMQRPPPGQSLPPQCLLPPGAMEGPQRDTPPQGPHLQGPQARPPPIPFQGSLPGQGPPPGRMPPDPRGLPLCPDWNRPAGLGMLQHHQSPGYLLHIQPPPMQSPLPGQSLPPQCLLQPGVLGGPPSGPPVHGGPHIGPHASHMNTAFFHRGDPSHQSLPPPHSSINGYHPLPMSQVWGIPESNRPHYGASPPEHRPNPPLLSQVELELIMNHHCEVNHAAILRAMSRARAGPQRGPPPQGPRPQGPQARPPPFQGSPPGQGRLPGRMPPDPRGLPPCPDCDRPPGPGMHHHHQSPDFLHHSRPPPGQGHPSRGLPRPGAMGDLWARVAASPHRSFSVTPQDPAEIAASIEALARKMHGDDAYIFDDLPRLQHSMNL